MVGPAQQDEQDLWLHHCVCFNFIIRVLLFELFYLYVVFSLSFLANSSLSLAFQEGSSVVNFVKVQVRFENNECYRGRNSTFPEERMLLDNGEGSYNPNSKMK